MTISKQQSIPMHAGIYFTAICIFTLSVFLVYSKIESPRDGLSMSIKENDDTYQMDVSYNPANTYRVQRFVNSSIAPNGLFKSENDYLNVSTTLADHTEFFVKSSPGKMKIEFDKRKNSYPSYLRIKKMCEGIKGVLNGK